MATFLVAHGAWSAGWAWKKMRPLMRAAGHEFWTPTYTGLGERAHLANPDVSLDTHIQDIVAVLDTEDLNDVILIGHSYGGMVATGIADRACARVRHLVYLDAFAPKNGQAVFEYSSQGVTVATGQSTARVQIVPVSQSGAVLTVTSIATVPIQLLAYSSARS